MEDGEFVEAEEEDECEEREVDEREIFVERTLGIIKPDAMDKYEEIEDIIIRSGFTIVQVTEVLSLQFELLLLNQ